MILSFGSKVPMATCDFFVYIRGQSDPLGLFPFYELLILREDFKTKLKRRWEKTTGKKEIPASQELST
jgi:hypothetical protein